MKRKKRKKRFGFLIPIFSNQDNTQCSNFDHPGVLLEHKEATEKLLNQINELPPNQKTAIILKAIDDIPQKEIATIMELSEKAVESLLSRAKKNLVEKIKYNEGNE